MQSKHRFENGKKTQKGTHFQPQILRSSSFFFRSGFLNFNNYVCIYKKTKKNEYLSLRMHAATQPKKVRFSCLHKN